VTLNPGWNTFAVQAFDYRGNIRFAFGE